MKWTNRLLLMSLGTVLCAGCDTDLVNDLSALVSTGDWILDLVKSVVCA